MKNTCGVVALVGPRFIQLVRYPASLDVFATHQIGMPKIEFAIDVRVHALLEAHRLDCMVSERGRICIRVRYGVTPASIESTEKMLHGRNAKRFRVLDLQLLQGVTHEDIAIRIVANGIRLLA